MGMEGNGNVYMGKQWEWEQMFGWHGNPGNGNGKGIETYGNEMGRNGKALYW